MDYKLEALDKSVRIALSNGEDNTERIIERAKAFSDFLEDL